MSDEYSPIKRDNPKRNWNSPAGVAIIAGIASVAVAAITGVLAIIAASIGSVHFSAPGGAIPTKTVTAAAHPTVTVTVTRAAGALPVNSALLNSALISAGTVGSGLSPIHNAPSITEICDAVAPSGAQSMATETLEDSQDSRMFTETIIKWDNTAHAASSIMIDETAASSACTGNSGQDTQDFSFADIGTAAQQCGGGPELAADLSTSNDSSNPNIVYEGTFIAEQCNDFTISIEDVNTSGTSNRNEDEGFLNYTAGRSPIIEEGK